MKFEADKFIFSVDLAAGAVHHINFLKFIDRINDLKTPKCLARSVYRYEKYWLPLTAQLSKECLSAPPDVEWVWHCHMLSPQAYAKDCSTLVGTVINHTIKELDQYSKSLERSNDLWRQRYGDEEPFYADFDLPLGEQTLNQFQSKISYSITEAAMRQKDFLYQVSLPHYKDKKFLEGAILRYKKFLFLKQQFPGEFIVPCYDIDLIWHTHQLHPLQYQADMVRYLGSLFNHDDTVTDRSEGSKLYKADLKTREHWKNLFREGFAKFGAMYRGKPPSGVLCELKPHDVGIVSTKKQLFT